jgi:hypothetical protein
MGPYRGPARDQGCQVRQRTAVHFSATPVGSAADRSGTVLVLRNMTKERELRRRLAWKASRDDLTGLLSRSEFRLNVNHSIQIAIATTSALPPDYFSRRRSSLNRVGAVNLMRRGKYFPSSVGGY